MSGNDRTVVGEQISDSLSVPQIKLIRIEMFFSLKLREIDGRKIHLALTQGCFQKAEGDDDASILSTLSCRSFSQCI